MLLLEAGYDYPGQTELLAHLGRTRKFAMMLVGFVGISTLASVQAALPILATTIYGSVRYYAFTIIPLFILMGGLAENAGITKELYDSFDKWFRRLPGGLGIATIVAIAGFSAISGSSIAAAVTIGTIALPEMKKYKYDDTLATACVAAGGTLDILIPPSSIFVVYAILTETSIVELFVAGFVPGIILALMFS